jgi:hypothetical protein
MQTLSIEIYSDFYLIKQRSCLIISEKYYYLTATVVRLPCSGPIVVVYGVNAQDMTHQADGDSTASQIQSF